MKGIIIILCVIAVSQAFCVMTPQLGFYCYSWNDLVTASDTRAVMGHIGYEDLVTGLTRLKVFDISNPDSPTAGYEYSSYYGFISPTVRENRLFYAKQNLGSYSIKIDDITDFNNPQNIATIPEPQCYAFAVHKSYMLVGLQNGDIKIYNFGEITNVQLANTPNVMPSIWRIYDLGDSIAVSCGNYSNPTIKILVLDEETYTFEERYSFNLQTRDMYVGVLNDKIVVRGENEHSYVYGWEINAMLMLNDIAPSPGWQSIIANDNVLYVSNGTDLIRALQYDDDTHQFGLLSSYTFPYSYNPSLKLMFAYGNSLVCAVYSYNFYWLDISDLQPNQDVLSQFDFNQKINRITYMDYNDGYLYCNTDTDNVLLNVNQDNSLSLNSVLENEPYMWNYKARGHYLYGLATSHDFPVLRVLDCSVPTQPFIYQQLYAESTELFSLKDDVIYAGWRNQPNKFRIQPLGFLSFEDSLADYYSDWVDFTDLIEYEGNDYGVCTSQEYPYGTIYSLLFYRQAGFTDGCLIQDQQGKFVYAYQNHLYSIGNQLVTYQQDDESIPAAENSGYDSFLFMNPIGLVGYGNFLIVAYSSSNRLVIYDLTNPSEPVIFRVIQQSVSPLSMSLAGDILYVANGEFGIAAYDLAELTPVIDDEETPIVTSLLKAYPNPFSDNLNLSFELKQPEKVTLKIYNIKGQLVRSIDSNIMDKGKNQLQWDGRDIKGKSCSGGIYLARLVTSQYTAVRKFIKLK